MPIYRYLVEPYDVTVSIVAENGNDSQPISYEGANADIVRTRLSEAYGAFGHGFNSDFGTPIDLHFALLSYPGMVLEMGTPIGNYETGLPEDLPT